MTAVDHAEPGRTTYEANSKQFDIHPFFCRAAEWDDLPADTKAHYAVVERTVRAPLLSEIEGLKADGEVYQQQADHEFAKRKEAERQLATLRTQAPDSWRPTRGQVINAICNASPFGPDYKHPDLLRMSDAILALRPQTAESGK